MVEEIGTKAPDHTRVGGCCALACTVSCDAATVHSTLQVECTRKQVGVPDVTAVFFQGPVNSEIIPKIV